MADAIRKFKIVNYDFFKDYILYLDTDETPIAIRKLFPNAYRYQSKIECNSKLKFIENKHKEFEKQCTVYITNDKKYSKIARIGFSLIDIQSIKKIESNKNFIPSLFNNFTIQNMPLPIRYNTKAHIKEILQKIETLKCFLVNAEYIYI